MTRSRSGGNPAFAGRRWHFAMSCCRRRSRFAASTVTAAFVSLRGLGKALTMDLGFKPQNALCTHFDLSQAGYASDAAADRFQRQLLERVSQIPGVGGGRLRECHRP